jgi:hypothetical protein
MTDKITYKAIIDRVESDVKEYTPELPKENTIEAWEAFIDECEALQEDAHENATESVYSWDWNIYTYRGFKVYDALPISEQNDAEQEYWECDQGIFAEGPYELGAGIAYFALVRLWVEECQSQCGELIEMANNQIENLE